MEKGSALDLIEADPSLYQGGLEPPRLSSAAFKAAASTIPPLVHMGRDELGAWKVVSTLRQFKPRGKTIFLQPPVCDT